MKNNDEIDRQAIGRRFKSIRTGLGLSQRELAEKLNISAATLCSIESGKGIPRHDAIYNLAAVYNVNIYYLLHGSGEMFMTDIITRQIESGEFKTYRGFLKEFLRYMRGSTVVRYNMMNFFWKYIIENETLIDKRYKFLSPV